MSARDPDRAREAARGREAAHREALGRGDLDIVTKLVTSLPDDQYGRAVGTLCEVVIGMSHRLAALEREARRR